GSVAVELAEEPAGGEEAGSQIRSQRPKRAVQRAFPHRHIPGRPRAGDRGADVESTSLVEQLLDVVLVGQVRADDGRTSELGRKCLRTVPALVVVVDDR